MASRWRSDAFRRIADSSVPSNLISDRAVLRWGAQTTPPRSGLVQQADEADGRLRLPQLIGKALGGDQRRGFNLSTRDAITIRGGEEISQAALDAERRQAMSYSISTLLTRNLHDVFGENDPARRRAAIDEIFTEDCVFYEPRGVYRGRDEIDRVAGAIKATHPDFRYQPIAGPEELGNGGRIQWVSGRSGEAPAYAGTDFIIVQDGRIAAVYLFFDKLP